MQTTTPTHPTTLKQDKSVEFEGLFPSSDLLAMHAEEEHFQEGLRIREGLDRSAPGTPSLADWREKAERWLAESDAFSQKQRPSSREARKRETQEETFCKSHRGNPEGNSEDATRETPTRQTAEQSHRAEAEPRSHSHGRPEPGATPGTPGHPASPDADPENPGTTGRPTPPDPAVEVNTLLEGGESVLLNQSPFADAHEGVSLRKHHIEAGRLLPSSRTACGKDTRNPRNRSGLEVLPDRQVEALKKRTPRCSYLPVPTELYERITDWRPVLSESKPLAALLQHVLFGMGRDEGWKFEQDCTGIPVPNSKLFAMFDYSSRQSGCSNAGLNSGMLLDLYREEVDEEFRVSDWNGKEGKARVIRAHGIPDDIVQKSKEVMLFPQTHDDWTLLVNGRSANRRSYTKSLRAERLAGVSDQEPVIEPPGYVRRIQKYLNELPQGRFGHGGYGIFKPEKVRLAIEATLEESSREKRRDDELRKLFWLRYYPQPLYKVCDHFPRLKAERANQAMNLPSNILRSMYTKRDVELDLTKAHLACMVPLANREGINASLLNEYLRRSMEGEDIWSGLAESFSNDHDWAPGVARATAKKIYALVYGSSLNNLFREMTMTYGKKTGEYLSFDAFRPVTNHELVDELLRIRSKLKSVINRRGGMEDAAGCFIPLSKWNETKNKEDRWRGVLAYVNASYEQKLMAEAFRIAEQENSRERPRFRIWLYQADGFTMRVASKYKPENQIERLQRAVRSKANDLNVPTKLEIDCQGQT